MKGKVLNVTRFCTDDGPGIRTTVFLKGCPLHCLWCHNPESQSPESEILFDAKKCVSCGLCFEICTNGCHQMKKDLHFFLRERCTVCGRCSDSCPTKALEVYGKSVSSEEVMEQIKRDITFYSVSGGGVTVSGGEPLYQHKFTSEILKECHKLGINTAIETSGYSSQDVFESVIDHCDLVLFDIKETDEQNHLRVTGVPFSPILKNLKFLDSQNIPFIIRAPIIPTLNDSADHFKKLKKLSEQLKNCKEVQIMPYHLLGNYKYELLGKKYLCSEISEPQKDKVDLWRSYVK